MDKHTIDLLKRINKCDKIDEVRDLIINFVTDDIKVEDRTYFIDSLCYTDSYGNKFWKNKDVQLHRINGPAVEYVNGTKEWFVNGRLHRTDGPAIEFADGSKLWSVNGQRLTEQEHRNRVYKWKDKQF